MYFISFIRTFLGALFYCLYNMNYNNCFIHNFGFSRRKFIRISHGVTQFKMSSILSDNIDLSGDNGILKRLIKRGNAAKGYPLVKDSVEIAWKFFSQNNTLLYDSKKQLLNESDGVNNQLFQFKIGNEPREVIVAFEYAVKSMFEGYFINTIYH